MSKGSKVSKAFMKTAKAMAGRNMSARHQRRAIDNMIQQEHKKIGRVRKD